MRKNELRSLLQERWTALEAEEVTGERRLRISELPVPTDSGLLAAAVDHDGHRHVLLPIHSHRRVRPGLDGPVLQLRKRPLEDPDTYQTYADLACLRDDLDDLFTEMCVDVLGAVSNAPAKPVKALYGVLDRWRALFRVEGIPLGPGQIAGLFGEVLVLNRLLERDPSAYRLWRGPEGYRHDFAAGRHALEVKASTASEGRRPRIHGLDQLEVPQGGSLCLVWFRLERITDSRAGTGFVETIRAALEACDDEAALLASLAAVGFHLSNADRYDDVRFIVGEERWYRVSPEFPSLTGSALLTAGVPVTVMDVTYTIDLSGETPAPLPADTVSRTLDSLIQESA